MTDVLRDGIVRILNAKNERVGTGFVVRATGGDGVPINSALIVTCAHVIEDAEVSSGGEVEIRYLKDDQPAKALATAKWWRPPEGCDIAVLLPQGSVPAGTRLLELGNSPGTENHPFDTFGFPAANPVKGLPDAGWIIGPISWGNCKALKLDTAGVTRGFSGAPVWDRLRQRVVGVINEVLKPDSTGQGAGAVALTSEELRQACPALQLSDICPYRALDIFREEDEKFFRGRKRIIEDLLKPIHEGPPALMTVLGPSGSGKSSVVRAGLIPEIRRKYKWGVIVSQPRTDPFSELAKEGLVGDSKDLIQRVSAWQRNHRDYERLLIVLDQFEELFVNTQQDLREDFLTALIQFEVDPKN